MTLIDKIKNYQKAGYAGLFVQTHEEGRFHRELLALTVQNLELSIYTWDTQFGLIHSAGPATIQRMPEDTNVSTAMLEYLQLLHDVRNVDFKKTEFILKDFHLHFDKVINIRLIRNLWDKLKARGSMVIFTGHKFTLPGELSKEVQLLEFELPGVAAIRERLAFVEESAKHSRVAQNLPVLEMDDDIREAAIDAAKGMTDAEIENAFALGIVTVKAFNHDFVKVVFNEKILQLKKSGLLRYEESNVSFENVGGHSGLKRWVLSRKPAYSQIARDYKLPLPKGILLASVPGSGKTHFGRAIASEFECPLFMCDIGALFDSLVGNTEKNMRELIATIESLGRCVVVLDEIEKSLNNNAVAGQGDSGVSSRIFGTFLTWLNDRTCPAFIIATSNDHTALPPALIRKGRFDQLFWMDLPSLEERIEICSVVIRKYGRNPDDFDVKGFARGAFNFTGAEIEEAFKDAMFKAFSTGKEVHDEHIKQTLAESIPFAVSHKEDLERMRSKAAGKLVMVSDEGNPVTEVEQTMRRLSIDIQ